MTEAGSTLLAYKEPVQRTGAHPCGPGTLFFDDELTRGAARRPHKEQVYFLRRMGLEVLSDGTPMIPVADSEELWVHAVGHLPPVISNTRTRASRTFEGRESRTNVYTPESPTASTHKAVSTLNRVPALSPLNDLCVILSIVAASYGKL